MINKMKNVLLMSAVPLVLFGCATDTKEPEQDDQEEIVNEKIEISNVKVEVTSEITEAVKKVDQAVVSIVNLKRNDFNSWSSFYGSEDQMDEYLQAGSGSGAIYKIEDDKAYIFTNNHVVEGSDAVDVLLSNGTQVPAEVIGTDLWTDLAVLSIDAEEVDSAIEFGDSDNLTVGEPAIAIGSPLGTEFASSVTSGIISGIERSVPVDTTGNREFDWEMTAIQTDAAINPGNSGGPLINIAGQVIGINSMKISSDTVEGMGFAIPSNDAVNIINELEETGEIVRPQVGITMVDLAYIPSAQRTEELKLPKDVTQGVAITRVAKDSPAEESGLEPADVIVGFDGEEVKNSVSLRKLIYESNIGDSIEVEYYRGGEPRVATIEMTAAQN